MKKFIIRISPIKVLKDGKMRTIGYIHWDEDGSIARFSLYRNRDGKITWP